MPEDDIDRELWKEKWDHGTKSGMNKVESLRPDPWDQSYLTENGIKFMSFHRFDFKHRAVNCILKPIHRALVAFVFGEDFNQISLNYTLGSV